MKIFGFKINPIIIILVGVLLSGLYLTTHGFYSARHTITGLGHGLILTAGIWIGCISIVGWLWKKYPWEFHPVKHLFIEIVLITAYTTVFTFGIYFIETRFELLDRQDGLLFDTFITLLITYLITTIHEMIYFYRQWKFHFSKSIRLEKDNIQAKYETLKTQINPHFLFNSLNSLTTLVDDNEKAVEYIQDLSEFFRYMLSSRDKELVLVREEIKLLEKYINLQQSRFKATLNIDIQVPEKFYHFAIPPLVLQMLVENSIKHNIISRDKPLHITLKAEGDSIIVENNLQKKSGVSSTGQGLKNIAGRYKIFTTREVIITETSSIFKVAIPLLTVEL